MDVAYEFIGRFHPALVHLPIGILILAVVFVWIDQHGRINVSPDVIRFTFGLGAVTAIFACLTGLLLSRDGGYDETAVNWHQWMAITTSVASVLLWRIRASLLKWTSTFMLVMLVVTGHLGASLTHGADYLTAPLKSGNSKTLNLSTVNYDSANMYQHIVAPILEQHCYTCHSDSKQKGKLRLDAPTYILTGGKNGKVIVPGNLQESELMERLRLPLEDDHHMPPKEKRQPGDLELGLIARWIEAGASFDIALKDVVNEKDWIAHSSNTKQNDVDDIPDDAVGAADEAVITGLRSIGVSISPVSQESNYLQVNMVSAPGDPNEHLAAMKDISSNVIWLKLGNTGLDDEMMSSLTQFKKLRRLGLERTLITDSGLEYLRALEDLSVLNLSGTKVSLDGLSNLSNLKKIRSLNLYQTQVRPDLLEQVKKLFPGAVIEFGEYEVPTLPTDTVLVK